MKQIILEQKETISIKDIDSLGYFIVVKTKEGTLLNYDNNELTEVVGGVVYEEFTLEELIEGGAEAYQIESIHEATQWIKNNL